ncbi:hypothetical protein ES703_32295 [subsurface metagenome]
MKDSKTKEAIMSMTDKEELIMMWQRAKAAIGLKKYSGTEEKHMKELKRLLETRIRAVEKQEREEERGGRSGYTRPTSNDDPEEERAREVNKR